MTQHHRSAIGSQFVPLDPDPNEDQSEYHVVAGLIAGRGVPAPAVAGAWICP